MTYAISDIHGQFDKYAQMLELIRFSDTDVMYILGDVIDRGACGIKTLLDMSQRANVVPIIGNHEFMALPILSTLTEPDGGYVKRNDLRLWVRNGGGATWREFVEVSQDDALQVVRYLHGFKRYAELNVSGTRYVLVHAGIPQGKTVAEIDTCPLSELVWVETDYEKRRLNNAVLVTGHTPTSLIDENSRDRILHKNGHIAIDCGAAYGGSLACYCFETAEEFYV